MNGMFGGMWFGWIFWIVIIIAIVWVVTQVINKNQQTNSNIKESPLDILKKRYAKGEITKEQYEEMKKDLL